MNVSRLTKGEPIFSYAEVEAKNPTVSGYDEDYPKNPTELGRDEDKKPTKVGFL